MFGLRTVGEKTQGGQGLREKYFIYTILAGFLLGCIICQTESLVLKAFAIVFTLTIATACAYAYNAERRDFSGIR